MSQIHFPNLIWPVFLMLYNVFSHNPFRNKENSTGQLKETWNFCFSVHYTCFIINQFHNKSIDPFHFIGVEYLKRDMLGIRLAFIYALAQVASGNNCYNGGARGRIIGGHIVPIEDKGKVKSQTTGLRLRLE